MIHFYEYIHVNRFKQIDAKQIFVPSDSALETANSRRSFIISKYGFQIYILICKVKTFFTKTIRTLIQFGTPIVYKEEECRKLKSL